MDRDDADTAMGMALVLAPERRGCGPPGRRQQWSRERVLQAVLDWDEELGCPPYAYEWEPSSARYHGHEDCPGVRKWLREYPRWPSTSAAVSFWGSWRALLTQAGLPSPPPLRMALSERLEIAEVMRGESAVVVAEIIGVHPQTVRGYWRAGRCPSCGGIKVAKTARVCALCVQRPTRRRLSRATVIAAIQAWERQTGTPPLADEWLLGGGKWDAEYPRWPALSQVQEAFGTWNKAIRAAGFDPRLQRWNAQEIIDAACSWARGQGEAPSTGDWATTARDGSHPSRGVAIARFGSWNAMLEAARLPISQRVWTREDILVALQEWTAAHGGTPRKEDWEGGPHDAYPSPTTVFNHFDGWNAMLRAGGAQLNRRRWTPEDILEACGEFERRHGRRVRSRELTNANGLPSPDTVAAHIGDHAALLDALDTWRSTAAPPADAHRVGEELDAREEGGSDCQVQCPNETSASSMTGRISGASSMTWPTRTRTLRAAMSEPRSS